MKKIISLYETWRKLNKTKPEKRYPSQIATVNAFVNSLGDFFDIATPDALEKIKI